jgi:hypothetical protein
MSSCAHTVARRLELRDGTFVFLCLRILSLAFAAIGLLGFRCAALGRTTYVYILDGGPPSSHSEGQLFSNAQSAYSGIPGFIIEIYNSDQTRRDDRSHTLVQDIGAQPLDSDTYVFAWSYGVYNVNAFIDAGMIIDVLYTIDGTTGPYSPVSLDLGALAEVVVNCVSGDSMLYGGSHQVSRSIDYSEFDFTTFTQHTEFLNYLESNFHILESLMNQAKRTALLDQGQPSGNPPESIGNSGEGGTESYPLWAFHGGPQYVSNSIRQLDLTPLTSLNDMLPTNGPNGELAITTSPPVVGITTAIAATGRNYIDTNTDTSVAGIFLTETVTNIYEHDYVVCRRVHGYDISEIAPFGYRGYFWWLISATNESNGYSEVAVPFIVYTRGTNAFIDSQYLVNLYAAKSFDHVYNFQIWAGSILEAAGLLDLVVQQVSEHFNVQYDNTNSYSYPPVIVRTAEYVAPYIRVDVVNRTTNSINVSFAGPVWTEPNFASESLFSNTVTILPGEQTNDLPVGCLHDAVMYVETPALSDKFYLASGYWFPFDDTSAGGTSSVSFQQQSLGNPLIPNTAYWFANPPAVNIEGNVTTNLSYSYVGVGYSLDPNNNPVDISAATGVGFWTKGDGRQYRVKVESTSVTNGDYHGYNFIAPTNWTMIEVPFSDLQQQSFGPPAVLDLHHVQTISFVTTERPYDPVFSIDRLALLGTPNPPLAISGSGSNVTLIWPNSASTFDLEGTSTLPLFLFETNIALRPQILGTNYSLDLPATNSVAFFRLRRD